MVDRPQDEAPEDARSARGCYCGFLGWTEKAYGRVTHKCGCPARSEPWCQAHPRGCTVPYKARDEVAPPPAVDRLEEALARIEAGLESDAEDAWEAVEELRAFITEARKEWLGRCQAPRLREELALAQAAVGEVRAQVASLRDAQSDRERVLLHEIDRLRKERDEQFESAMFHLAEFKRVYGDYLDLKERGCAAS